MLKASEAMELAKLENFPVKVWEKCDQALDEAVLKAIETGKKKVSLALWYEKCKEDDETVKAYLEQLGYKNIKVTHDYPWYNEDYDWKTFIEFTF